MFYTYVCLFIVHLRSDALPVYLLWLVYVQFLASWLLYDERPEALLIRTASAATTSFR